MAECIVYKQFCGPVEPAGSSFMTPVGKFAGYLIRAEKRGRVA